jgi:flagellar biogenesis protein FliO
MSQSLDPVSDKFVKLQHEMAIPDPISDTAISGSSGMHSLGLGLEIGFVLILVLALAVITIRLLKKLQGGLLRGKTPGNAGDILEVVETCHLGTGQRIVALRMGERIGIVGITKESFHLLHMLEQSAETVLSTKQGNPQVFSENLNRLLDRFKKPKKVSELLQES